MLYCLLQSWLCNPVLVWEGRGENGEDLRGDGNHTVLGAGQSKHAVDIPVMRCGTAPDVGAVDGRGGDFLFIQGARGSGWSTRRLLGAVTGAGTRSRWA